MKHSSQPTISFSSSKYSSGKEGSTCFKGILLISGKSREAEPSSAGMDRGLSGLSDRPLNCRGRRKLYKCAWSS